jgi:hypothetical protein
MPPLVVFARKTRRHHQGLHPFFCLNNFCYIFLTNSCNVCSHFKMIFSIKHVLLWTSLIQYCKTRIYPKPSGAKIYQPMYQLSNDLVDVYGFHSSAEIFSSRKTWVAIEYSQISNVLRRLRQGILTEGEVSVHLTSFYQLVQIG